MRDKLIAFTFVLVAIATPGSHASAATIEPAVNINLGNRLAITALIEKLRAELNATDSATLFLEGWCSRYGLGSPAKIVAQRMAGEVPLSAQQRQELEISDPQEPVIYRRVALACGDTVLSEADNWYLPRRLTPEINMVLTETNTPFGRAIQSLGPSRRTLSSILTWRALPREWELMSTSQLTAEVATAPLVTYDPANALFENRAIVLRRDGTPVSEVRETYKMSLIAFRFR